MQRLFGLPHFPVHSQLFRRGGHLGPIAAPLRRRRSLPANGAAGPPGAGYFRSCGAPPPPLPRQNCRVFLEAGRPARIARCARLAKSVRSRDRAIGGRRPVAKAVRASGSRLNARNTPVALRNASAARIKTCFPATRRAPAATAVRPHSHSPSGESGPAPAHARRLLQFFAHQRRIDPQPLRRVGGEFVPRNAVGQAPDMRQQIVECLVLALRRAPGEELLGPPDQVFGMPLGPSEAAV